MAQMIPPSYDESTSSHAETTLYFHLANHLSDDWTAIHSLPYLSQSRSYVQEGECDFLLLHPRHGLLVIEAKSGTPGYDGKTRQWSYDDGRRVTDPFAQAQKSMHFLVDLLRRDCLAWRSANLAYGYAVAFPEACSVVGNLRPDMGMDLLLLEPDLDRIQDAVIRTLARFGPPAGGNDQRAIDALLDVLQPSFRLAPALGRALQPTIESARREFVRLTDEQAGTLEGLGDNPRLLVRGRAGTGKTLLVATEAYRLAAAGRRVLVLCFNRRLAAFLRTELAALTDEPGEAFVGTFHDLCTEILRTAGAASPDANHPGYWDQLLPDAALEALPDFAPRYDAILVDEAQDFRADWWLLIEELLADRAASTFHLFGDDQQNLFGRRGELPFEKPVFHLKRNCRNTASIAAYTLTAAGLDPDDAATRGLPEGPEPVVHEVTDSASERDAVRRVLHEVVHDGSVAPDDIVLLGCHKLEKSSFAGGAKLGNLTIRDIESDPAPNTVRYATVHKFKGLEADCVLLTGIDQPSNYYDEGHMARFVYVGGSRARVVLHVFRWASSETR